jgi:asparaginyl-tRNA synthetase
MSVVPVADVLQGRVAVDQEVTVRGWVRTRRDSKAGISFLAVYDGSCFDPVQAVINNSLPNYNDEVLHLTTGCSVIVTGKVVASPGQGQSFEIQALPLKSPAGLKIRILTRWRQNATASSICVKWRTCVRVPT